MYHQRAEDRSRFKQMAALSPPTAAIASPPRTPKSTPRGKVNENLSSNIPVAVWSRSKSDRFTGPGSLYASSAQEQRTPGKQVTPRKMAAQADLPDVTERYATVAERVLSKPSKAVTPSATYTSKTDRFTLPGGVHEASLTPGVGSYDVKVSEEKIQGAVKLQKAVRRRQSRGIFAQIEAHAREMPSPGKYNPSTEACEGHAAFSKDTRPRFVGHLSLYDRDETPSAGDYDPEQRPVIGGGAKSAFRGHVDRFEGLNSIYKSDIVPGVGEYEAPGGLGADSGASNVHASAAYRCKADGSGYADRFDGPNSVYASSDAPGVGSYELHDSSQSQWASRNASYSSTTDRFKLKGGVYDAAAAGTPGVGAYDIKPNEAKIRGAVKLQKAIRRRQSRGIFAQIESRAREVPSPGKYTRETSTSNFATIGGGFAKASKERFEGHNSIYAHGNTPAVGEYDTGAFKTVISEMPSATARSSTARFDGPSSIYGNAATTPSKGDSLSKMGTPSKSAPKPTPPKSIPKFTTAKQIEEPKARKAQPEVPSWVKQPKPYPEKPEDAMVSAVATLKEEPIVVPTQDINEISTTHSELASTEKPPTVEAEPSFDSLFPGSPSVASDLSPNSPPKMEFSSSDLSATDRYSVGGTALGAYTEARFSGVSAHDLPADRYSVGGTALGAYTAPRFSGTFSEGGTAVGVYVPLPRPGVNASVDPVLIDGEKWYSAAETFEKCATVLEDEGQQLFEELLTLDTSVSKDDYYSASDGWDLNGLQSDLQLYRLQGS